MNSTPPQNTVIPAIPTASRWAGDAKKLKADSDHHYVNELAKNASPSTVAARLHKDARPSVKFYSQTCNLQQYRYSFPLRLYRRHSRFCGPLFPVKAAPPYSGEVIIIGDDLVRRLCKDNPLKHEMIALEKPGAEIEENAYTNWMNFDR